MAKSSDTPQRTTSHGSTPRTRRQLSPFGLTSFGGFEPLFERLMDAGNGDVLAPFGSESLLTPLDVAETDKNVIVKLEIPGMDADDIDVRVLGDRLTISGEKTLRDESGDEDADYHRVETRYGSFSRTVTLPTAVQTDDIDADYSKGVLTVKLPKSEKRPSSRIKVKSKD